MTTGAGRRRSWRLLVPLLLLVAAAVGAYSVAAAPPASAESPVESGWWWKGRPSRAVPAAVATVPPVPDGGLYVGSDPTGPAGVSLLRFNVPEDAQSALITLTVADAVGTPEVMACPAADVVTPEAGGPWDEQPQADCGGLRADGALDADGVTIQFDLGSLVGPGTLDVVLVPRENLAPEAATFSVAFDPPDEGTMQLALSDDPSSDTTTTTTTAEPAPLGVDSGSGVGLDFEPLDVPPPDPAPAEEAPQQAWVAEPPSEPVAQVLDDVPVEGFRYAGVVVLPLVFLLFTAYFGWALTRPVFRASGGAG